jgi:hypothetical protein
LLENWNCYHHGRIYNLELFHSLDIETVSSCNRVCPTCLRNSHPDRKEVSSWFEKKLLPIPIIKQILEESIDLGFHELVCFSHFNEPLMDERLPEIVQMAKEYNVFDKISLNSNGDYINENIAKSLDGNLDRIIVTLYMDNPIKAERALWIPTLFTQTEVQVITFSEHIATHFSPKFDVVSLAQRYIDSDCKEPAMRCIINHRQQYLLCCEDLVGNFGLGKFPETSIKDYWYGNAHQTIHDNLLQQGGRRTHPYCSICPKS